MGEWGHDDYNRNIRGGMMADVVEIDAATGAVIERDFTPEELAQREADALAAAEAQAAWKHRSRSRKP